MRERSTFSESWIGERSQEIGSGLARWVIEPHVNEELLGLIGGPEVDLTSFAKYGDLVKNLGGTYELLVYSLNTNQVTHIVDILRA
jgi:hypothetical protein